MIGPLSFFFAGAVPATAALTRGADPWSIAVTVGVFAMGAVRGKGGGPCGRRNIPRRAAGSSVHA